VTTLGGSGEQLLLTGPQDLQARLRGRQRSHPPPLPHNPGLRAHRGAALCAVPPGPSGWVRGRRDLGAAKKTNTDVFSWDQEVEKSTPPPRPDCVLPRAWGSWGNAGPGRSRRSPAGSPSPHGVRAGPAPSPGFPRALLSLSLCLSCSFSGSRVPTRPRSPSLASRAGSL
jgi:hypothetical protein